MRDICSTINKSAVCVIIDANAMLIPYRFEHSKPIPLNADNLGLRKTLRK